MLDAWCNCRNSFIAEISIEFFHSLTCTLSFLSQTTKKNISTHAKVRHLHYLIKTLFPFLEQICYEQTQEMQIEATMRGIVLFSI